MSSRNYVTKGVKNNKGPTATSKVPFVQRARIDKRSVGVSPEAVADHAVTGGSDDPLPSLILGRLGKIAEGGGPKATGQQEQERRPLRRVNWQRFPASNVFAQAVRQVFLAKRS